MGSDLELEGPLQNPAGCLEHGNQFRILLVMSKTRLLGIAYHGANGTPATGSNTRKHRPLAIQGQQI